MPYLVRTVEGIKVNLKVSFAIALSEQWLSDEVIVLYSLRSIISVTVLNKG